MFEYVELGRLMKLSFVIGNAVDLEKIQVQFIRCGLFEMVARY